MFLNIMAVKTFLVKFLIEFWKLLLSTEIIPVKTIKKICDSNDLFSLDILNKISKLDLTEACRKLDTCTKIMKENADIFSEVLNLLFDVLVNEEICSSDFKLADITPIFKKDSKDSRDNYTPISIFKNLSKVFEQIMHE